MSKKKNAPAKNVPSFEVSYDASDIRNLASALSEAAVLHPTAVTFLVRVGVPGQIAEDVANDLLDLVGVDANFDAGAKAILFEVIDRYALRIG